MESHQATSRILMGFLAFTLSACNDFTDRGRECFLVKRDPADATGKRAIRIKESEMKVNKDFISFGSVECDNRVCVRDSAFQPSAGVTNESDAIGYCSSVCTKGSTADCPSVDSSKPLVCRALLLDEATLAAIKETDPALFSRFFGETTSPFFCVRGTPGADAGT